MLAVEGPIAYHLAGSQRVPEQELPYAPLLALGVVLTELLDANRVRRQ
jgi:hypothetical protein